MIGLWGAFIGAAAGSGPFVGSLIVHQFGWRSIFYLNLPIGLWGVILTALVLQQSRRKPRPFDFASHLLMVGALSAISFTLIEGPPLGWFASREAAMRVFWEKGYDAASLTDLTDAMGVRRTSLYLAFGNKDALFRKAIAHYRAGPMRYIQQALDRPIFSEAFRVDSLAICW
jgi:MFS family permease